MPLSSRALFYSGVFAFFASIGFISLLMGTSRLGPAQIAITVLIMGGFAIFYAAVSVIGKHWAIPIIVVLEGLVFSVLKGHYRTAERLVDPASPLHAQHVLLGVGAIVFVAGGYILFIRFFAQQGE